MWQTTQRPGCSLVLWETNRMKNLNLYHKTWTWSGRSLTANNRRWCSDLMLKPNDSHYISSRSTDNRPQRPRRTPTVSKRFKTNSATAVSRPPGRSFWPTPEKPRRLPGVSGSTRCCWCVRTCGSQQIRKKRLRCGTIEADMTALSF